jgi:multidrug efflux pump
MMCAHTLRGSHNGAGDAEPRHGIIWRMSEGFFQFVFRVYERCLGWVLRRQPLMLAVTMATIALTVRLYIVIPKGFFPQQDTGRLSGQIQADQATSFPANVAANHSGIGYSAGGPGGAERHGVYGRPGRGTE